MEPDHTETVIREGLHIQTGFNIQIVPVLSPITDATKNAYHCIQNNRVCSQKTQILDRYIMRFACMC